ncbi:MAG: hypothetical protein ABIP49_06420, partial [Lysobacterales bacterium]
MFSASAHGSARLLPAALRAASFEGVACQYPIAAPASAPVPVPGCGHPVNPSNTEAGDVAAAAAGDRAAFRRLYDRHVPHVHGVLRRL